MTSLRLLPLLAGLCLASTASAQLLSQNLGRYDNFGVSDTSAYTTGRFDDGYAFRSFFVFDRPGTTVHAARLELFNPFPTDDYPEAGFTSADAWETLSVFDVTTDLTSLLDGSANAFDDLGSGTLFGEVSVSDADDGSWITIDLNADFLALLNGGSGQFALGLSLTSLRDTFGEWEVVFAGSESEPAARLYVALPQTPVPEPSTYGLIGAGVLLGVAALRRRNR